MQRGCESRPRAGAALTCPHQPHLHRHLPHSTVDLAHLPQDDAVYAMLTRGRHDRRLPGRVARADGDAAAAEADDVSTISSSRSRSSAPAPSSGRWCIRFSIAAPDASRWSSIIRSLEPVLARTLGVPLFQEQLLRMAMVVAGFTGGQAEELRRAMGFKRSEKKMRQIEVQLREGMAKNGITGEAADRIVLSITSFALYGFPESHAASFALLAYASAYLKMHFPAAFYTALLNNQPMGFYHPATLVKDAQRRGVRFAPIDVQMSDWDCTVTAEGVIRLGLRYVSGLREEVGKRIAGCRVRGAGDRESGAGLDAGSPALGTIYSDQRDVASVTVTRSPAPGPRTPDLSQMRLRRPLDDRSQPTAASATSARITGRRSRAVAATIRLARGSGAPHRPAPRRDHGAGRDRRAQCVRPRSAFGAVAGRARGPSGR